MENLYLEENQKNIQYTRCQLNIIIHNMKYLQNNTMVELIDYNTEEKYSVFYKEKEVFIYKNNKYIQINNIDFYNLFGFNFLLYDLKKVGSWINAIQTNYEKKEFEFIGLVKNKIYIDKIINYAKNMLSKCSIEVNSIDSLNTQLSGKFYNTCDFVILITQISDNIFLIQFVLNNDDYTLKFNTPTHNVRGYESGYKYY